MTVKMLIFFAIIFLFVWYFFYEISLLKRKWNTILIWAWWIGLSLSNNTYYYSYSYYYYHHQINNNFLFFARTKLIFENISNSNYLVHMAQAFFFLFEKSRQWWRLKKEKERVKWVCRCRCCCWEFSLSFYFIFMSERPFPFCSLSLRISALEGVSIQIMSIISGTKRKRQQ